MTIKLDQPRTIKRIRIEHAEYGGEAKDMNTIAFSVQYKSGNNWVTVYSTTNNSSAVTDELITPVTAQEWRLYISNSGSSPWGAIRIYEWQMFETTERNRTDIVLMKFASAKTTRAQAIRSVSPMLRRAARFVSICVTQTGTTRRLLPKKLRAAQSASPALITAAMQDACSTRFRKASRKRVSSSAPPLMQNPAR